MAFSGARTAPWDGSTLLLDASGMLNANAMGPAGPTSLDALLFDVDDADPVLTCSPRIVTTGAFAKAEAPLMPAPVALSTGHMFKTYPSSETRPLAGKRRANGPATRGKWPWPLRSERNDRVPQKEQRERLVQDLKEMEAFVAELSASRSRPSLSAAGDHETIAVMRVKSEREAKREAECRNQRLRQLNMEHAKRLKRIDRIVTQSLSDYDQLRVSERLQYDEEKDAALYRDLFNGQGVQLKQMDDVFRAAGISREMKDVETAQVVTDDKGGAFIRFVHARLMPFPMMTILRAMKRYHRQYMVFPEQTGASAEDQEDPFATMAIKARFMLRHVDAANAKPVPLDSRGIGKVVRDGSDSVRGIWAGHGEWPPEYTPDGASSLPIREKGWARLREFRSRGGQVYTLMQSCLHMTPGVTGGDGGMPVMPAECVALLADVIIPSYTNILHGRQQMMENAYMDELMREQKVGGSISSSDKNKRLPVKTR